MVYNTSTNMYGISRWIADNVNFSPYTTVQSAINACNAEGGGTVIVRQGVFVENLTLYGNVNLEGTGDPAGIVITGAHTLPAAGSVNIKNMTLNSATHVFASAAAGTTAISFNDVFSTSTNGYFLNIPNWTGSIYLENYASEGTNDGFINNTGGSSVTSYNSVIGAGIGNTANFSGVCFFVDTIISCPSNFQLNSTYTIRNSEFNNTATFSNNTTGTISHSKFDTGATAAITQSSAGALTLSSSSIDSAANPVIAGAGAGAINLGNIDYLNGKNIAATLNIVYDSAIGRISPYIVGATGNYSTIQAAITAANAASVRATVYVQPGTYTENLTFFDGIEVVGAIDIVDSQNLTIIGTHTPPAAGFISIGRAILQSATHIFNSAAAGTTTIYIFECALKQTNGYTFNLPNWTGSLEVNDCGDTGTNNGFINNTGGATIFTNNCQVGAGAANPMIANGNIRLDLTFIVPPVQITGAGNNAFNFVIFGNTVSFGGSSTNVVSLGSDFFGTATTAGTAILEIFDSTLATGATPAINHGSAGVLTIANTIIDSSNNPVIAGAGAGLVQLGSVTYLDGVNIAGTITKDFTTRLETGVLKLNDATVGVCISTAGVISATTPLDVGNGGLGVANPTDHSVLVGSGATAVTPIGVGATGTLLGGNTAADPAFTSSSDGNFTFTSATATVNRTVTISNTDNTAVASPANLQVTVGGGTNTGDPYVNFLVSAAGTYSVGIDNTVAGDPFKITSGASPSAGTDLFTMTSTGVITLNNDLDVTEGGTGVSTLTSHGILMGNGAGDINATAEPANGQFLIGKTGDFPQLATLTPGPGISITSGAGTCTVSAVGMGLSWSVIGVSGALVNNNAYICTGGAALTFSLPAVSAVGTSLGLSLDGSTSWSITQAANQSIRLGANVTTIGVGGSLTSTAQGDTVLLVCSVANLTWNVISSIGNLTIV